MGGHLGVTTRLKSDDPIDYLGDGFLNRHFLPALKGEDGFGRTFQEKDKVRVDIDFLPVEAGNLDHSIPLPILQKDLGRWL
jgi:hypothetical protein